MPAGDTQAFKPTWCNIVAIVVIDVVIYSFYWDKLNITVYTFTVDYEIKMHMSCSKFYLKCCQNYNLKYCISTNTQISAIFVLSQKETWLSV